MSSDHATAVPARRAPPKITAPQFTAAEAVEWVRDFGHRHDGCPVAMAECRRVLDVEAALWGDLASGIVRQLRAYAPVVTPADRAEAMADYRAARRRQAAAAHHAAIAARWGTIHGIVEAQPRAAAAAEAVGHGRSLHWALVAAKVDAEAGLPPAPPEPF